MPEIRHRIGIDAPAADVFAALATPDGISRWWTREVTGDATVGGTLSYFFAGPEPGLVSEVTAVEPGRRVGWRVIDGPSDWIGTEIDFALAEEDGETVLMFAHEGWRDPTPFMSHCSTKWAYFLLGLKSLLEGGQAHPAPDDLALSRTLA